MRVGIDILENSRMLEIANSNIKLSKIFTDREIMYFNNFSEKLTHITGNFCAKEAFVKALGVGFSNNINVKDVEILHNQNKVPYINLENEKLKKMIGNSKVEISISHCETTSTAICIIYE